MQLTVTVDFSRFNRKIRSAERQVLFAGSRALTEVARAARDEMGNQVARDLDRPTPWIRRGFYAVPARRDRLYSIVGVKDKQAEILRYQIQGGTRRPRKVAIQTPQRVALNSYGNIPKRTVAQLIAAAKGEKKMQRRTGRRIGVSNKVTLFYGEPGDGRPAGIYKRVPVRGSAEGQLISIVSFPKTPAVYRPRLRFAPTVHGVVQRRFGALFAAELGKALASAR